MSTVHSMIPSTCPAWCEQHSDNGDGTATHRHVLALEVPPVPRAGDPGRVLSLVVEQLVGAWGGEGFADAPQFVLQTRTGPLPVAVSTAEVRELVAAFTEGLAMIDEAESAMCVECGAPTIPALADGCTACQVRAMVAARPRLVR